MNSDFDERSGVACCKTPWGNWYQTVEDVVIVINVEKGTRGKEVNVVIEPQHISCVVRGRELFSGRLRQGILVDESTWSVEDQKIIRILLVKRSHKKEYCFWPSLFENGEFAVDTLTKDQMQKNLTLERFELENPGFDFSNAEITGNYEDGGPTLDLRKEY